MKFINSELPGFADKTTGTLTTVIPTAADMNPTIAGHQKFATFRWSILGCECTN